MLRKSALIAGAFAMLAAGSIFAQSTINDVPFPTGYRDWFLVNTMIVTKDSPSFTQIGGMHHIYVNAAALPTLKAGGPYPYPDGSVFADDVHEFSLKDGSWVEGGKKAVTVMVKDSKKDASTGGWGFGRFIDGKPVDEAQHKTCFPCHAAYAKEHDFIFTRYAP